MAKETANKIPATILIAEDDEDLCNLMQKGLARAGFETEIVYNGAAAIRKATTISPNLVLLDYMLPDMSAESVIDVLNQQDPPIPFIIAIGRGDEKTAVDMMKLGAQDYIVKDYNFLDRLPLVVKQTLDKLATENKLRSAEEKLIASALQWQHTFDAMNEPVCLLNSQHIMLRCNKAMVNFVGKSMDEILGRPCWEIVHCTDKPVDDCPLERMKQTGKKETMLLETGDRIFDVTVQPEFDVNGVLVGSVHIISDITERKQAEEALIEKEKLHNEAQKVAHIGHWELDPKVGTPVWSDEIFRIFGLEPQQGEPSFTAHETHLHPDDWPSLNDAVTRSSRDGTSFGLIFRIVRPNGEIRWMHALGTSIKDKEGKVERLFGTAQDITGRKQAEEKLIESEQRLLLHMENSPMALIEWDSSFVVTRWAGEALNMFGWSAEETVGRPIMDLNLIYKDDVPIVEETMARLTDGVVPYVISNNRNNTKSGAVIDCTWYNSVLLDDSGKMKSVMSLVLDITERKQAEKEIRKLSNAVEQSIDGIAISDLEPKLIFVNKAFAQIHGYTVDEMLGMKVENIHSAEQQQEFKSRIGQIQREGLWVGEIGHMKKDGSTFPTFMTTTLLKDDQGGPIGVLSLARDITVQKQAEEALRASEGKYENLVEQGNDGIIIIQDTVLKFINSKMAEMAGYERDELMGKPFIEFIAPGYRELVIDRYKKRIAGFAVPSEYEIAILRKDSTEMPVEINASLTEYEGVPADMAIVLDITQRKLAEDKLKQYAENLEQMVEERTQELKDSEEWFRMLLASANDAVYAYYHDEDGVRGNFIEVNDAAVKMMGYSREELLNMGPADIKDPDSKLDYAGIRKKFDVDKHVVFESVQVTKNERKVPVEVSANLFPYKGKSISVNIVRDISDRQELQKKLISSEKLAVVGQLASGVAHEIRNPLAIINNANYILNLKSDVEDSLVQKQLAIVKEQVFRCSNIVEGLLNYAVAVKPILEEENLNNMISEVIDPVIVPDKIKVTVKLNKDIPTIHVDRRQIVRVFYNIVINAIQSMPNGGSITISAAKKDGYVRIDIHDIGAGILPADLKYIFDPMFTTKIDMGGIGIGLAICKTIVEAHNGMLSVVSEVGKGTTFTIQIPLAGGD